MPDLNRFIKNGNYYYFGDAPRHISGLTLNKSSISLNTVGQTQQLIATISPQGAIEKDIVWSSSDESIATVSQTGLVTCVTPGECTITATCGGYSASCSVIQRKDVYADFLLVGGGGAGAGWYGGGGGGGGVIECSNYYLAQGGYSVTVGSGGSGWTSSRAGVNGGNSVFNGLIAYGGGGGGGSTSNGCNGCNGGSGGGAGYSYSNLVYGGTGCSGQGNNGGCSSSNRYGSGGGGGAGGVGGNAAVCFGGDGGVGKSSSITGVSVYYSGGGNGYSGYGCVNSISDCGRTPSGITGTNAVCCGSGGGGTYCCCGNVGKGGNGVFILRYPTACGHNITGGTKYTCGNYTIHCFTSSGTLTVN